jgi:protein-S-isoprenylcysteine O-methyltransferase Ste14
MYLAMLLGTLALAVYLQNIASFFILPLFITYLTRYQIIPEEQMLETLFGEEFNAYCRKVRRWL